MRENSLYIMNLCHMVSILSDSLIFCCGGLLPLMASATSTNFENDVLEACGGMELESAFSFMNRVLNVVDVIAFASSINFASVETHRNMSAGGVLRQCIRLGMFVLSSCCYFIICQFCYCFNDCKLTVLEIILNHIFNF